MLTLFVFLPITPFAAAWKNGSYADAASSYSYIANYGTHDWVAEGALNGLYAVDSSGWQWLVNKENIFFVGTEAPDNSGVTMTLDGTAITGFGDVTSHHIYFNEDGTIYNNEDDAGIRAKWCGDNADAAIDAKKWDLAAFYLGAMTHYIADLGVFAHVLDGVDSGLHADFEGYVNTRSNNHTNREEFFSIFSFTVTSKTPYTAAKDLAWDTLKDPSSSRGAQWLLDNLFSTWKVTLSQRADDTQAHQIYYNRVETNLNNAIAAVASAMNYVLGGTSSGSTSGSDIYQSTDYNDIPGYPLPFLIGFVSLAAIGLLARKRGKIIS